MHSYATACDCADDSCMAAISLSKTTAEGSLLWSAICSTAYAMCHTICQQMSVSSSAAVPECSVVYLQLWVASSAAVVQHLLHQWDL